MNVFVVIHTHKFGVDIQVFKTEENAENCLYDINNEIDFDSDNEFVEIIETELKE